MSRFLKFVLVGLLATIVHVAIVFLLVEGTGAEPVLASLPAFLAALSVSYLLNRRWTFESAVPNFRSFPKYLLVAVGGLLLNAAIMYVTVHVAHGPYLLGLAVVVSVVPVLSFMFQRDWSFGGLGRQTE